jgi:hypothetical protein
MIGQMLGSYRIVEQIGLGGMATVYKAYDPATDRYVALKILPAHYSQDPSFQERFRREAKAIARLEHPHILPIHTYGEEDGTAYLVMRYLPSGTLKQRIERGTLGLGEVTIILGQLADALDYAHERGILHRDIKPSNILLDEKGNVYLSDFGIARMVEAAGDLTGSGLLGTPAYMSPEQCQGSKDLTPASDQYSLGIVLYEMVTGRTPFQAETPIALIHMHLSDPLPPPRSLRPDLPEGLEKAMLKALSRDPKDRWPSCAALAGAISKALAEAGIQAYPSPTQGAVRTTEGVAMDFGETIPAAPPTTRRAVARRGLPLWVWGIIGILGLGIVAGTLALAAVFGGKAALTAPQPIGQTQLPPAITTQAGAAAPAGQTGKILRQCGNDLCIDSPSNSAKLGLDAAYTVSGGDAYYAWSPDGARIAFVACPGKDNTTFQNCSGGNLYLVNPDGSNVTSIFAGPGVKVFGVSWSPDGNWIAADTDGLTIFRPDGTGRQVLVPSGTTRAFATAWSPDSQHIAWVGGTCGYQECTQDHVYVIDRDGSHMKLLFTSPDVRLSNIIAWTPDGKSVAVVPSYGTIYQIKTDCASGPAGCDETSRTRIDSLPDSWLPTFYPQWAGGN